MSNPNPASEAGGIFPGMGEAPSDPDWNAPLDGKGMTPDDAATSAFDDHDRAHHGIAEGEREEIGGFLKGHADAAGTTVRDGLNALISPAVALRHGNMETKRHVVGQIIDDYSVQPMPTVEPEQTLDEFGYPVQGAAAPAVSEQAMLETVQNFTASHPDAMDPAIHDGMLRVLDDMVRQGYAPNLETAYEHTIKARDGEHLSRAKQASVQVSGGASVSPNQASDDLAGILNELIP